MQENMVIFIMHVEKLRAAQNIHLCSRNKLFIYSTHKKRNHKNWLLSSLPHLKFTETASSTYKRADLSSRNKK